MTPYLTDPDFTLWNGDALDVLRELPADSVDCALTSPPFYGLRDYGTGTWEGGDEGCEHLVRENVAVESSGLGGGKATTGHQREGFNVECPRCGARRVDRQIGLEATPDEWVARLVAVFAEVRRVLKPQGTLWVECGDSYANGPVSGTAGQWNGSSPLGQNRNAQATVEALKQTQRPPGTKPKDLLLQPFMLAFALRADGWYLRQAIVWAKPNAMPESVRDRCTTAHSYVFLLSKNPRYWFDADAIAEPAEWARWGDQTVPKYEGTATASGWMQPKTKAELVARGGRITNGQRERTAEMRGFDNRLDRADGMKNARSVWTVPTSGYAEAHFATWPEALVERILKAGCPEWVCVKCGKARERVTEREATRPGVTGGATPYDSGRPDGLTLRAGGFGGGNTETVGWSDCGCGAGFIPGTALDPFMGSGTTALVARRLGRRSVGVELNAEYCEMAARRVSKRQRAPLPADFAPASDGTLNLFAEPA